MADLAKIKAIYLCVICFLMYFIPGYAVQKEPVKDPGVAALWGHLPGMGHLYLGDNKTAGYFALASVLEVAGVSSEDSKIKNLSAMYLANTIRYSVYSSFRDANNILRENGYDHYRMPNETIGEISTAPFDWSIIKKPEVHRVILASVLGASAITWLAEVVYPTEEGKNNNDNFLNEIRSDELSGLGYLGLFTESIAVGEESYYRGFMQPSLSRYLGDTGGWITSSLVFAIDHVSNGFNLSGNRKKQFYTFYLPYITLLGFILGDISKKNTSLRESTAVHFWYDFFILSASTIIDPLGAKGKSFTVSFSF